jgi:hypothetical protein
MNDVSILLPLARTSAEFDRLLAPSTAGRGGPLVPRPLYDDAMGADTPADDATDTPMRYASLRLVSVRFDPCFANIGPIVDPASCHDQMRVVFQPYDFASGDGPADGALHVFYSLTRAEVLEALDAIAALREASSGTANLGPLAVHPIAAKEGLTGPFVSGVSALLTKYAGTANLVRFTGFREDAPNVVAEWGFHGFDVAGGVATPIAIPKLKGPQASLVTFSVAVASDFMPESSASDNMQLLGDDVRARAADMAMQQAAFDAALRIENPSFHSPNTIDCASCHLSGPAVQVGANVGLTTAGNPNVFALASAFVSSADMAQTTPPDTPPVTINVHMFSYLDTTPSIAMRTINETAAIVDYLDGLKK